ncbi:alpha/beta fold hydrolase [Actinoplanes sp. NPDC049265]|uniref:alpha/beta fold hydrolase n=1 Tax=Actinoplanes sp. NPDC049265 TaxID=3363902 RepID=UPI0037115DC7
MTEIRSRHLDVNGIRIHVTEAGSGPLVLLLHGFPETAYSYRHQLTALAAAGFHAVAPDQRGYPHTEQPPSVGDYTIHHLIGDAVGLINALGAPDAVTVGHDWGSPVAWGVAQARPDLVRGVVSLSVPFGSRQPHEPLDRIRAAYGDNFYQLYFQEPGVAERELERDPGTAFRKVFYAYSGDAPEIGDLICDENGWTGPLTDPVKLPGWLTEQDIAVYAEAFTGHGFTGALNWYRNITRNWELTAAWQGLLIDRPAMFLGGDRDPVVNWFDPAALRPIMAATVTNLTSYTLLEGAGHWIQQERAAETNAALIEFVSSVS